MTDTTLDQLRNQLVDGFRDARVPQTPLDIADDFEVPEVRELAGKHWSVIPLATISRMNWDLGWFTPLGIRQYLPAFMMAAAGGEDETAETTIKYLQDGSGERDQLWPDEKRAVQLWLRFMRDKLKNDDAANALATYWENPATQPLDDERVALFRRARQEFAPDRTPDAAIELAAAVTKGLEEGGGDFYRYVSVIRPYDAANRIPIASVLSTAQLAFMADFVDYQLRRSPGLDSEATVLFWRAQLAARGA